MKKRLLGTILTAALCVAIGASACFFAACSIDSGDSGDNGNKNEQETPDTPGGDDTENPSVDDNGSNSGGDDTENPGGDDTNTDNTKREAVKREVTEEDVAIFANAIDASNAYDGSYTTTTEYESVDYDDDSTEYEDAVCIIMYDKETGDVHYSVSYEEYYTTGDYYDEDSGIACVYVVGDEDGGLKAYMQYGTSKYEMDPDDIGYMYEYFTSLSTSMYMVDTDVNMGYIILMGSNILYYEDTFADFISGVAEEYEISTVEALETLLCELFIGEVNDEHEFYILDDGDSLTFKIDFAFTDEYSYGYNYDYESGSYLYTRTYTYDVDATLSYTITDGKITGFTEEMDETATMTTTEDDSVSTDYITGLYDMQIAYEADTSLMETDFSDYAPYVPVTEITSDNLDLLDDLKAFLDIDYSGGYFYEEADTCYSYYGGAGSYHAYYLTDYPVQATYDPETGTLVLCYYNYDHYLNFIKSDDNTVACYIRIYDDSYWGYTYYKISDISSYEQLTAIYEQYSKISGAYIGGSVSDAGTLDEAETYLAGYKLDKSYIESIVSEVFDFSNEDDTLISFDVDELGEGVTTLTFNRSNGVAYYTLTTTYTITSEDTLAAYEVTETVEIELNPDGTVDSITSKVSFPVTDNNTDVICEICHTRTYSYSYYKWMVETDFSNYTEYVPYAD